MQGQRDCVTALLLAGERLPGGSLGFSGAAAAALGEFEFLKELDVLSSARVQYL